jgi:protein-S-isoprenylcysteine O-methyltransferase Ste14
MTESPEERSRGWVSVLSIAATVLALAASVALAGVPAFERSIYLAITTAFPRSDLFHGFSDLGSMTVLYPASALLAMALPRSFFRRWWVWVGVMLLTSVLEGLAKQYIGRPRPEALRPGFPSAHTAAAAAFYLMAAYFAAATVRRRWAQWAMYGLAAVPIALVALARIVLRMHWPLDVVGGAALGVMIVAAGAWWHERHPVESTVQRDVAGRWQAWLHRWQAIVPLPFYVVIFRSSLFVEEEGIMDLVVDASGAVVVGIGLLLRVWAVHHAGKQGLVFAGPDALVTTGPYAHMRHPIVLGNFLVGMGTMLLAESGIGLIVIVTLMVLVCRITIPFEEDRLRLRFGASYRDYCARVPRFPRFTPALLRAGLERPSWRAVRHDLPAIATGMVLAALAEASEFLPR